MRERALAAALVAELVSSGVRFRGVGAGRGGRGGGGVRAWAGAWLRVARMLAACSWGSAWMMVIVVTVWLPLVEVDEEMTPRGVVILPVRLMISWRMEVSTAMEKSASPEGRLWRWLWLPRGGGWDGICARCPRWW